MFSPDYCSFFSLFFSAESSYLPPARSILSLTKRRITPIIVIKALKNKRNTSPRWQLRNVTIAYIESSPAITFSIATQFKFLWSYIFKCNSINSIDRCTVNNSIFQILCKSLKLSNKIISSHHILEILQKNCYLSRISTFYGQWISQIPSPQPGIWEFPQLQVFQENIQLCSYKSCR